MGLAHDVEMHQGVCGCCWGRERFYVHGELKLGKDTVD